MTLFSAVRGLWWVASEVVDAAKQLVAFTPGQDEESPKNERCAREAGSSFPVKHGPGSPHLQRESIAAGATLTPDEAAERLAEYEAGVECLEPQDDCGLGGPVTRVDRRCECGHMESAHNGPIGDCSQRCLCVLCPADTTNDCWCASFYPHSSAAPGVAPVEAADNDPGAHPPTRAPGSQTSLTADELVTAAWALTHFARGELAVKDSEKWEAFAAKFQAAADEVAPGNLARRGLGYEAAVSGGVTQLHRVVDLVDAGADPDRIKQWCERQIEKRTLSNDPASVHARTMRQRQGEDREQ